MSQTASLVSPTESAVPEQHQTTGLHSAQAQARKIPLLTSMLGTGPRPISSVLAFDEDSAPVERYDVDPVLFAPQVQQARAWIEVAETKLDMELSARLQLFQDPLRAGRARWRRGSAHRDLSGQARPLGTELRPAMDHRLSDRYLTGRRRHDTRTSNSTACPEEAPESLALALGGGAARRGGRPRRAARTRLSPGVTRSGLRTGARRTRCVPV
jgi:hypothetical protein